MDENNYNENEQAEVHAPESSVNDADIAETITPAAHYTSQDEPVAQYVPSAPPALDYVQKTNPTSVSYAPVNVAAKREKKPKYARLSSVVAICLVAVILCGCAGFGGAFLANSLSSQTSRKPSVTDPLVVYRDVSAAVLNASTDGESMTYAEVAAMVKNSVVEINTEYTKRSAWFQYVSGGAGSGVIISEDGYIATNAHVVMNDTSSALADTITIRLPNGAEYDAQCMGYDTDMDIAVLKIDVTGLVPAICGDSDNLSVGEELVIVGNPLGELGGTVTNGIVSATEREIEVSGKKMTLIQTNAAINPGNSGGGMFDMAGRLVGIVNAKSSGTDIEGLGFAIPVNNVLSVTEQLIQYGYVRGKVTTGVKFRTVSTNSMFGYYSIRPGVYVESLTPGYNDDVLQVGDRIIAVNGDEITSETDITAKISGCSVGDTLKFQLYRSGKLIEVTVTCYEETPDKDKVSFGQDDAEKWTIPDGEYSVSPFDIEDFFSKFFGGF